MNFTIDRALWSRGESDAGDVALVRARDGKMCCLGFFLLACGVARERMVDCPDPETLANESYWADEFPALASFLVADVDVLASGYRKHREVTFDLMTVNDDDEITDTIREATLAQLFAKHGVTVSFVGSLEVCSV